MGSDIRFNYWYQNPPEIYISDTNLICRRFRPNYFGSWFSSNKWCSQGAKVGLGFRDQKYQGLSHRFWVFKSKSHCLVGFGLQFSGSGLGIKKVMDSSLGFQVPNYITTSNRQVDSFHKLQQILNWTCCLCMMNIPKLSNILSLAMIWILSKLAVGQATQSLQGTYTH